MGKRKNARGDPAKVSTPKAAASISTPKQSISKKRKKGGLAEQYKSGHTPKHAQSHHDDWESHEEYAAEPGEYQLRMEPGEAFAIEGLVLARVVQGSAWVHGCPLAPSSGEVLLLSNPRVSSAIVLEAPEEGLQPLSADPCPQPAPPPARHTEPCLVNLRPLHMALQPELTGVELAAGSQGAHWESIHSPAKLRPVTLPGAWRTAVTQIQHDAWSEQLPSPVVVVAGPKGVGKSTLSRFVVNSLLGTCPTVAYLDLDPGQPEIGFPGTLTLALVHAPLLGPPQLRQLAAAAAARLQGPAAAQVSGMMPVVVGQHFVGDIKPEGDPEGFMEGVGALHHMWMETLQGGGVPLVVNTMGWVKGLGMDLLQATLSQVQPTHLLQLQSPSPAKNLPDAVFWDAPATEAPGDAGTTPAAQPQCIIHRLHTTAAAIDTGEAGYSAWDSPGMTPEAPKPSSAWTGAGSGGLPASDSRAMMWLALAEQLSGPRGSLPAPGRGVEACGVWELASAGPKAQDNGGGIAGGLSGNMFASVARQLAATPPYMVPLDSLKITVQHEEVAPTQLLYVLNGALVGLMGDERRCLGLGLVGSLELPTQLLTCPEFSSPYISHHKWAITGEGTGATVIRGRNNIRRNYASAR
ncbi:hypothetical protein CYMTET_40495 [Cymbomonas tetramitiformis]|uniref:Clp1 P-loop domain-containing protein n=1 Tax=Cymbomonas tetramitiformis TaxID=36881 RepID=A0AAE0C808_9CHLO|nr:hypothetical protein CYMTET_40495 [Cymbomonas tetramitiformis]